jgi:hypothetical protein
VTRGAVQVFYSQEAFVKHWYSIFVLETVQPLQPQTTTAIKSAYPIM